MDHKVSSCTGGVVERIINGIVSFHWVTPSSVSLGKSPGCIQAAVLCIYCQKVPYMLLRFDPLYTSKREGKTKSYIRFTHKRYVHASARELMPSLFNGDRSLIKANVFSCTTRRRVKYIIFCRDDKSARQKHQVPCMLLPLTLPACISYRPFFS